MDMPPSSPVWAASERPSIPHPTVNLADKKTPVIERKKTPAGAVAHIRQSRKGVTLGGLKIKNLIHEGHRY